jgi:uncharacterized membrane protein
MAYKTINKRKIVLIILLVTLFMMPISGVYVHITHGAANSHRWLHIHVLFGILFLVTGIYHVVYNWKALKNYLIGKKK